MKRWIFFFLLFFTCRSEAEVLFEDPTGDELNAAFDQFTKQEVEAGSTSSDSQQQYMLGLLYLRGDNRFDVRQDCQKSFSFLSNAWEDGIVDAGYALATMYYQGVCVDKNIDKAEEFATQAAEDGYILAQRMLGMAYIKKNWDDLLSKNIAKGVFWLSKAGEAGDRVSAGQLAHMYSEGGEIPRDDSESFYWLKKGIFNRFEEGSIASFPVLAERYERGEGTEIDLVKAYKYYDLSGSAGAKSKQRIADEMTQDQIDEALRQSQEWQDEHNVQVGGGLIRRAD